MMQLRFIYPSISVKNWLRDENEKGTMVVGEGEGEGL